MRNGIDFFAALRPLEQYLQSYRDARNIPGMAIAVTDRTTTMWTGRFGYADIAAQKPIEAETLFQTGSIGKSFTGIALLQEHEAGRLDLHAPVTEYLPWFSVRSRFGPITIHHLLSHTGGIVSGFDFSPDSRIQAWALRETDAYWAPGEHFHYSNDGYKVLGLVLEAVRGQKYAETMRSLILDPLGMRVTHPTITEETRRTSAIGYRPFYDDRPSRRGDPLVPAAWFDTDTADGCLASSLEDMTRYVRMLLGKGQGPESRIMSEESFALLTQRVIEVDEDAGVWYGYGMFTRDDAGHEVSGHSGGMPGFVSQISFDVDAGIGIVCLINAAGLTSAGMPQHVLRAARAASAGETLPEPPAIEDPMLVENAGEFAGWYRAGERAFEVLAEGNSLEMEWKGSRVALEHRRADGFQALHPDFALFLLRFEREDEKVARAVYGPDLYVRDGFAGPPEAAIPDEWRAYVGHYRSFTPWFSNFRVISRGDQLILVTPEGTDVPLEFEEGSRFRLSEVEPGYVRFGPMVDGEAIGATLSGGEYYRIDAP